MSKDSSANHYQKNKERLHKKACERYQDLFEEKIKNENLVAKDMKIFLIMK